MRGSSEKPLNIMCTRPKKRQDRYSLPNASFVGCNLVLRNTVAVTNPTNATFTEHTSVSDQKHTRLYHRDRVTSYKEFYASHKDSTKAYL